MSFLAPLWLLGLFPWAGLTLWLLWGRRPRVGVPFVALWQISAVDVRAKRNLQTPPIAVALVILSVLLGILVAARPVMRGWGGRSDVPILIVLDRGASMSARSHDAAGDHYRFQTVAHHLARELSDAGEASLPIRLFDLVDQREQRLRADQLPNHVNELLPTLFDTHGAMQNAVRVAARDPATPVVVITDQPITPIRGSSLVVVAPTDGVRNISIVDLVVRRSPTQQIMVRIKNAGVATTTATLNVTSGDWRTTQPIMLPAPGSEQNYFIDADRLGDSTRAELTGIADDFPADDQREVAREGSWPRIESRVPLPPAMARLLTSYRAHRLTVSTSPEVVIVVAPSELAENSTGLVLQIPSDAPLTSVDRLTIQPHPLTQAVNFQTLPRELRLSLEAPNWEPIVSGAGHVLVAAREQPARQIWVGFDPTGWAGSPDFVVFFSHCLDWLAAGGAQDRSHPLDEVNATWKPVRPASISEYSGPTPGIYRRPDGALQAFELPSVHFDSVPHSGSNAAILALVRSRRPRHQIGGDLLVTALCLLAAAVLTWRRQHASLALLSAHPVPRTDIEVASASVAQRL